MLLDAAQASSEELQVYLRDWPFSSIKLLLPDLKKLAVHLLAGIVLFLGQSAGALNLVAR